MRLRVISARGVFILDIGPSMEAALCLGHIERSAPAEQQWDELNGMIPATLAVGTGLGSVKSRKR